MSQSDIEVTKYEVRKIETPAFRVSYNNQDGYVSIVVPKGSQVMVVKAVELPELIELLQKILPEPSGEPTA